MSIKRRRNVQVEYNMASMTDVIFLLLIFFMITSTVVTPNAIKVVLPRSSQQTAAKPLTRVTIDKRLNYYAAFGNQRERQIRFDEIVPFLQNSYNRSQDMYVALYADETIPYSEVIKVMDIVNRNNFKMILVTRPR
jgi:biopolymer transport protein ExbD